MYITPVSLMRDGTEGCPCQSMLLKWGTLEGGGLFVKVLFNHFAVEESAILRGEEGVSGVSVKGGKVRVWKCVKGVGAYHERERLCPEGVRVGR